MNKNFFIGLFMGLSLLLIFAFRPARDGKPLTEQKWEYKIGDWGGNAEKTQLKMNTMGAEGWELVFFDAAYGFFYKRPIE